MNIVDNGPEQPNESGDDNSVADSKGSSDSKDDNEVEKSESKSDDETEHNDHEHEDNEANNKTHELLKFRILEPKVKILNLMMEIMKMILMNCLKLRNLNQKMTNKMIQN